MKAKIVIVLLLACALFANGQETQPASKSYIRFDGIYECKEWKFIDDKIDSPAPAYYRFFDDGSLLFCEYQNPKEISKDSMANAKEIFQTVLTLATLNKIRDNMTDDPANVFMKKNKLKITAYKYQKIVGGICFDILSERPNCLGKPNIKLVSNDIIKIQNQTGDAADDRLFKFILIN